MNNNNINTVNTIFSNRLNINTISLEESTSLYITVQDDIRFNNSINVSSNLIVGGSTITVNSQTLTINDRFICYLIPPSMISSDVPALKGITLFKTIGEQTENIRYLAGYPTANIGINELKNSLVPTVGQIVDLLKYLGLDTHMNGNQNNLASTYS